jgi:hypothetical protein
MVVNKHGERLYSGLVATETAHLQKVRAPWQYGSMTVRLKYRLCVVPSASSQLPCNEMLLLLLLARRIVA